MTTRKPEEPEEAGSPQRAPSNEPDVEELRSRLERYMSEHGLRSTDQRRVIVDKLFTDAPAHVTIDGMLEMVKREDSRIGYATVYRTMRMLGEAGILHEYKFSDGMTRYELADSHGHHDHIICMDCGLIQEFEEPLIEELQNRIAAQMGFNLRHHKHELYGRCTTERCPHREEALASSQTVTVKES